MGTFVVAGKCRASAIFNTNETLTVNCALLERPPFTVTFWTEYGGAFEIPIPLFLAFEARGLANSIKEAGEIFANWARGLNTIIALAVNADTGLLEPELIFDASPEKDQHDYFQVFIAEDAIRAIPNRRIDVGLVQGLMAAIAKHSQADRLRRAAAQYSQALSLWRPGHEIECLAHLYIAVEAISKAVLRDHLRRAQISEDELAEKWKVEGTTKLERRKNIESEVRRQLIFCNDIACYREARKISDGFEHGYSDYDEVRKPAQELIVRCAHYVRRAIISILDLEHSVFERLFEPNYAEPRGPVSIIRYLRGTLSGKAEQLAAPDQRYPIMHWRTRIKSVIVDTEGKYSILPEETLTAKIGDGIQFHAVSYEIWDGSKAVDKGPAPMTLVPDPFEKL